MLPRGAADCGCIWPSEEPVDGNGRNRSPKRCDACEPGSGRLSQMAGGHRGNWSVAWVARHRPQAGDSHYHPASTLLDFPRKCLFLSLPRWEVAFLLISSLFITGALWGEWAAERGRESRDTDSGEEKNKYKERIYCYCMIFLTFYPRKGHDDIEWLSEPGMDHSGFLIASVLSAPTSLCSA